MAGAGEGRAKAGGGELNLSDGIAGGVYEKIRDDVAGGHLPPGQALSELSLSRQYGVSRSPVREALASLERDGLVERRGRMSFVRERSVDEMLDIYQVRMLLEGAIAADAAQRRHPHDMRRLRSAVDAGREVDRADPQALVSANRIFHDALAQASHNQTLVDLQARLTAQVAVMPATTLGAPGRWEVALTEHEQIVDAVEAADAAAARALAEQHMAAARDIRVRFTTAGH